MQRLVNPGKRLPDKAGEPDFYEISRKYPLPQAPTAQELDPTLGLSPHHGRPGQPGRFLFPPSQAGGYPYGYYQGAPYPQLPSPASNYPGQPYPPQPPQQAYWPNQLPPTMYPPNPTAYGYYPYPQMMAPQGYDPQTYQHPSAMYGQYYPTTPTAYANPLSPGRLKSGAEGQSEPQAQTQPQPIPGQPGQYYPSPARADRPTSSEADVADDSKPPARAGVKRPLEEPHAGEASEEYPPQSGASGHHLEGSDPSQHAATAAAAATRSAQDEGTYNPAGYKEQQPATAHVPGASAKGPSGGPTAAAAAGRGPGRRGPGPAPKEEGGDGINEQQLLQDFFQHF
ncbi:hypothetical protein ACHAWF_009899 [Thalassiosira exigua]